MNFPKRKHREVRKVVVAPPGHLLLVADYGQLEGRVIAMASKDENLKADIKYADEHPNDRVDMHWKWLLRIIELYPPYMDRLARHSGETKEDSILKAGRTIIKTDFVFASFYRARFETIAGTTGIPLPILKQLHEEEFWPRYAAVKRWQEELYRQYELTGTIQTLTGYGRDGVIPGNEFVNNPIQGTAAHIVLDAQNVLEEKGVEEKDPFLIPRMNVHDSLMFIVPDDSRAGDYLDATGKEMVAARYPWVNTPLAVEFEAGYNWEELTTIQKVVGEEWK